MLNLTDGILPQSKVNFTGFVLEPNAMLNNNTVYFEKLNALSFNTNITNAMIYDVAFSKITGTTSAITNTMINDVAFSKITGTTSAITNTMINDVAFSKITGTTSAITNTMINDVAFGKITGTTSAITNAMFTDNTINGARILDATITHSKFYSGFIDYCLPVVNKSYGVQISGSPQQDYY